MTHPFDAIEESDSTASSEFTYKPRPAQKKMFEAVKRAFEKNLILSIEAPTGVGKSLAYLFASLNHLNDYPQERVVISTATRQLQEQLFHKDITLACRLLHRENFTEYALLKGRNNYLCRHRFESWKRMHQNLFSEQNAHLLKNLQQWTETTSTGDLSDFSDNLPTEIWQAICGHQDDCLISRCPEDAENCFFYQAKEKAQNARLIVVNHQLLAYDLFIKHHILNQNDVSALLPVFNRLVLDEAHHFPKSLLQVFEKKLNRFSISHGLSFITAHTRGLFSILASMKSFDIQENLRKHFEALQKSFEKLDRAWLKQLSENDYQDWTNRPFAGIALKKLESFIEEINHFLHFLELLPENFEEESDYRSEIYYLFPLLKSRLLFFLEITDKLRTAHYPEHHAYWLEKLSWRSEPYVQLTHALLKLDDTLEVIYPHLKTLIFTSATLSIEGKLDHWKRELCLKDLTNHHDLILQTPFNYTQRSVFFISTEASYTIWLTDSKLRIIESLIREMHGRTLILTTSRRDCLAFAQGLRSFCEKEQFPLLVQGERSLKHLVSEFRENSRSVLIGMDSLWEGLDIPGESLELVFLAKLPFPSIKDPYIQAGSSYLLKQQRDPFLELQLPRAIIRFKQGIGRLLRRETDKGFIICLDSRLSQKSYGNHFLRSLPPCPVEKIRSDALIERIRHFQNTWSKEQS